MTEKDRIVKLMELQEMSAKQFAEEVGIQPGTISNIMSDRNKPSLDVMQRILRRFNQVSSDWLILGEGPIYDQKSNSQQTLFDIPPINDTTNIIPHEEKLGASMVSPTKTSKTILPQAEPLIQSIPRTITKITVFYDDGTFQELTT